MQVVCSRWSRLAVVVVRGLPVYTYHSRTTVKGYRNTWEEVSLRYLRSLLPRARDSTPNLELAVPVPTRAVCRTQALQQRVSPR